MQDAHRPLGTGTSEGHATSRRGVVIEAEVNHTGQLQRHPKSFLGDIVTGAPELPGAIQGGMLFCGNNGGHQPRGQRIVPVLAPLRCETSSENFVSVSPNDGGTAKVTCKAIADLPSLDQYCTPGQVAFDFVPCSLTSDVTYMDEEEDPPAVIETARHRCSLLNCGTLRWDKSKGAPERRAYDICEGPIPVP